MSAAELAAKEAAVFGMVEALVGYGFDLANAGASREGAIAAGQSVSLDLMRGRGDRPPSDAGRMPRIPDRNLAPGYRVDRGAVNEDAPAWRQVLELLELEGVRELHAEVRAGEVRYDAVVQVRS